MNQSNSNKRIDFLVIGVQKCGTSALDYYLRQHPEIEMAKKKELNFFNNEIIYSENQISYYKLENQFDFSQGGKIRGEATPVYIYWESSCRRIWEYNQDIKLIAILRNPIERAFSHWKMEVDRNNESKDFIYCIKNERSRSKTALPLQHRIYSYVDRGFYSEQIRRLRRYFNDGQILFIKYDDFVDNQEHELKKTFVFLGVDPESFVFKHSLVRVGNNKSEITYKERAYLNSIYKNEIKEVERLLNWNCSEWSNKN